MANYGGFEMINYTLEIEARTLERMGEMISHLSEDYTKISAKYLQLLGKIEQLEHQKQKVIALIKDGRFVEALQELENEL